MLAAMLRSRQHCLYYHRTRTAAERTARLLVIGPVDDPRIEEAERVTNHGQARVIAEDEAIIRLDLKELLQD